MPRRPLLLLLLLAPAALPGEEDHDKVVAAVSPSVVRIDISRSSAYAKAKYWGVAPKPEWPGQLGRFDAAAAAKAVPADAPNRARILRTIREHDLGDPKHVPESYGSGVVVGKDLVLTNAHVVKNATRAFVRLPGKRGSWADVWACDPRSDLAVLKLIDPPPGLKAIDFGDGGKVKQGEKVLCLANEFAPGFRGGDPTLWAGKVSAVRTRLVGKTSEVERARYPLHHLGNLLQLSGDITPGCSGGVLLDRHGKAIGLTSAIAAVRGKGRGTFAIPLDTNTKRVIEVLKKGEEVEYGFLGVVLDNRDEDAANKGVYLYRVSPGTPAFRAGLQTGDRIVKIDGHAVRSNDDLFLFIGMALAGNTARVVVTRRGQEVTCDAKLAKFYVPGNIIAAKQPPARFGLRVDWTSVLLVRNPFLRVAPTSGVAIREVVAGSPADKARLQADKVITHVDGTAVNTPAAYYREVARAGKKVELTYLASDGTSEQLTLQEK